MAVGAGLVAAMDGLGAAVKGATQAITTGISVYQDIGKGLINIQTALIKGLAG